MIDVLTFSAAVLLTTKFLFFFRETGEGNFMPYLIKKLDRMEKLKKMEVLKQTIWLNIWSQAMTMTENLQNE